MQAPEYNAFTFWRPQPDELVEMEPEDDDDDPHHAASGSFLKKRAEAEEALSQQNGEDEDEGEDEGEAGHRANDMHAAMSASARGQH